MTSHTTADKYFWELNLSALTDTIIILDIDGTIAEMYSDDVSPETLHALESIKERNEIFLFSNNPNPKRLILFANKLTLPHISSKYKKPDPRILRALPNHHDKPLLIIGDKVLTDGLFAIFIKAPFLKVRRIRNSRESLLLRLSYWLDDVVSPLVNAMNLLR